MWLRDFASFSGLWFSRRTHVRCFNEIEYKVATTTWPFNVVWQLFANMLRMSTRLWCNCLRWPFGMNYLETAYPTCRLGPRLHQTSIIQDLKAIARQWRWGCGPITMSLSSPRLCPSRVWEEHPWSCSGWSTLSWSGAMISVKMKWMISKGNLVFVIPVFWVVLSGSKRQAVRGWCSGWNRRPLASPQTITIL